MENNDITFLYGIAKRHSLGALTQPPRALSGGFSHKMYSLFTSDGNYAVKLLNPEIMRRPDTMDNFHRAEQLEAMLEERALPIIAAKRIDGVKMQSFGGRYYYIFDWFDGKALKDGEVCEKHCAAAAAVLAGIHTIGRREQMFCGDAPDTDWSALADRLIAADAALGAELSDCTDTLYDMQRRAADAVKRVPPQISVCHNDMDMKNVLWRGDECRVIDLECLSYQSPYIELFEMLLCWSGYEECAVRPALMRAFTCSYARSGGLLPDDWETLYYADCGRLGWLEYNIERALNSSVSEDERALGREQVSQTLSHIRYYARAKDEILSILSGIKNE